MNFSFRFFASLLSLFFLIACGSEPSQPSQESPMGETDQQTETPSVSIGQATNQISGLLLSYYNDLSQEKLDENTYFAPTLDRFFNSEQVSRDQVAKSIRQGFEQMDARNISLDRSSIQVEQVGDRYVAEFSGISRFTRAGESSSEEQTFTNRVTFNAQNQIVAFESVEASQPASRSRSLAPAGETSSQGGDPLAVAKVLLQCFRKGDFSEAAPYIHPEKGYYMLTHPGAVSVPFHLNKADQMFSQAPWFRKGLPGLRSEPKVEELPDFDCGELFSKEGSFMGPVSDYQEVSGLMKTLVEYELGDYKAADIEQAQTLEADITVQIIDTEESLSLLLGQIGGKWYLLVVDIATYDCSA
jgi:hypothetical protein